MTEIELKLLKNLLDGANAAQEAKCDLTILTKEVKKKSLEAFLSRDVHLKNAVLMANMRLIDSLAKDIIVLIDKNQKVSLAFSGMISDIERALDNDSYEEEDE